MQLQTQFSLNKCVCACVQSPVHIDELFERACRNAGSDSLLSFQVCWINDDILADNWMERERLGNELRLNVSSVQGEREGSSRSPVKRADCSRPFSLSHWMLFVACAGRFVLFKWEMNIRDACVQLFILFFFKHKYYLILSMFVYFHHAYFYGLPSFASNRCCSLRLQKAEGHHVEDREELVRPSRVKEIHICWARCEDAALNGKAWYKRGSIRSDLATKLCHLS